MTPVFIEYGFGPYGLGVYFYDASYKGRGFRIVMFIKADDS